MKIKKNKNNNKEILQFTIELKSFNSIQISILFIVLLLEETAGSALGLGPI